MAKSNLASVISTRRLGIFLINLQVSHSRASPSVVISSFPHPFEIPTAFYSYERVITDSGGAYSGGLHDGIDLAS